MKLKFNINKTKASVLGSVFASFGAILASSCCIISIMFFNIGIGGAWLGNLAVLHPYRFHFISVSVLMFAAGLFLFVRGQLKTKEVCDPKDGKLIKRVPIMLTVSAILIAAAIVWPEMEPFLLRAIR
jgi:mercuric ion transport protein|tara:strand:+ start:2853 stop:3233 length:381 start_codon:yes stop_codon:yes gene_type:complete